MAAVLLERATFHIENPPLYMNGRRLSQTAAVALERGP
jgi:hypothetical protein